MKTDRNILIAFLLNISFSILEFFGGIFTNSIAITSDSIHDLGDAFSIGIAYFLEKKSTKKPDKKHTYGYIRYSVMGSIITTFILLLGSIFVIYESVKRIITPADINYNGMLVFSIFGVIINLLASIVTKDEGSLNQKAVNLHMLEDVLGWVDIELEECGPYDAICKPIAMAPCTSDVHIVWGHAYMSDAPNRVVGHEATAEVVKVGDKVKDFKPGDRVIVPAITPDWLTVPAEEGFSQHCYGMGTGMSFVTFKHGVFAEQFHVNQADANLAHLPEHVSLEQAVMISDMMTTGFYAAELADIQPGETVACFGIGPVGLMALAGAQIKGASHLIAVGSRPAAIKVAKEYGANDIVDYHNGNTVDQIMDLTDGKGVDKVVIGGGGKDTLSEALSVLKVGGIIGNVLHYDGIETIPIDGLSWGQGLADKTIRGGVCPGGRARMEKLANLIEYGRFDSSKLITHKFDKFDDIEEAMILMRDKPRDLIKPAVILDD